MRIALLQLNSRHDKPANIAAIETMFAERIAGSGVDLVVAPEYATFLGGTVQQQHAAAEQFPEGEGYRAMQNLARRYAVAFHIGSMIESDGGAYYNTAIAFGPDGTELCRYRKIHLFDVETPSGHMFRESDVIQRGSEIVDYPLGKHRIGCAICYDLRFPELFLAHMKAGCDIITIPAAFNLETGKDHWEVMIRTRAIETQCYVVAPGQIGLHEEPGGARACYGNSMIVDPWGTVIARASAQPGVTIAELDFAYLEHVRAKLPSNSHHVIA